MLFRSTEELDELNQVLVKQLKNRYSDVGANRRFVIGIDRSKMRLYDCEQSAQDDILDGPVMDKTEFGKRLADTGGKKFDKSMFEDFR